MKTEFELKTGPQGHVYFRKKIREFFGDKMKLVPNAKAGVIFPEDAHLNDVISSLKVIIQDLELRAKEPSSDEWDSQNWTLQAWGDLPAPWPHPEDFEGWKRWVKRRNMTWKVASV